MLKKVKILGTDWELKPQSTLEISTSGHTEHKNLVISYDPDCAKAYLRDTILHECLHACFFSVGKGRKEQTIRALTPVLLDMIRSNPKLIKFLTEK